VSDDPRDDVGHDLSRRDMISTMGTIAAGAFVVSPHVAEAMRQVRAAMAAGVAYQPKNFTPQEWETVRMLVDYIIPRDSHSGSATDAGVPEFMDVMLGLEPSLVGRHRAGLTWLDTECINRHNKFFTLITDAQRRLVLDDIAWPAKARPELAPGVNWFNSFRDFTASGFYTSKIGVKDIGYLGNTAVAAWQGCPPAAVRRAVRGQ
jgi:gluconate 2-dehydrogenase gamma chain